MPLSKEQKELLSRMRADNAAAPPPFRTKGWWEKTNATLSRLFEKDGLDDVVNQKYNQCFAGGQEQDWITEGYLDWMTGGKWRNTVELAKMLLALRIGEKYGYIESYWSTLPYDALTAIESILSIVKPISLRDATIVEIGAGWGRIGYALQEVSSFHRYIIYDLPESLLVSLHYLRTVMKKARYPSFQGREYYHGSYNELLPDPGVYYLAAEHILDLPDKSADIIISIASFQEMPDDYVDMYFDIIDKKGKYLYTLQRGDPKERPYCPASPHWELLFSRHPLWSDGYYEAMFKL